MKNYTLSQLQTFDDLLEEELQDPEFRAEWERTALARSIALLVLRYRTEQGLSQTEFAKKLGMSQPAIARLEQASHNPTFETLIKLSIVMDLEIAIDIKPQGKQGKLINSKYRGTALLDDGGVVVAAV